MLKEPGECGGGAQEEREGDPQSGEIREAHGALLVDDVNGRWGRLTNALFFGTHEFIIGFCKLFKIARNDFRWELVIDGGQARSHQVSGEIFTG